MKASQVNQYADSLIQTEIENIYRTLNKVSFGTTFNDRAENIDAYLVSVTANTVASDDTSITHDLKRTPVGFIVVSKSGSGDFYDGTGTNSDTLFYLKCTTASTRFKVILI